MRLSSCTPSTDRAEPVAAKHGNARGGLLVALLLAAAGATAAPAFTTGGEWPSYNKSLDGQRYSPLRQITAENVGGLAEVCRVKLEDHGSFQSGLVVLDDVMYATTATDTVALDPASCKVKWRHSFRREKNAPLPVNRGVAYFGGKLFRGTDDGHVLALDAKTGAEVWTSAIGDPAMGEFVSGSPMAWNGIVIVGTAASEFGVRGRVIAFDAATGRELWRFNTVPAEGEPGAETWKGSRWNNLTGGGGGTWTHFALDPVTAEVFIPVGNPIPDFVPAERPGDNLYTNSVLVLDARTGKLRWWYQLAPSDGLDHDLAAAPVLYRNSEGKQLFAAGGKDGYVHIVDRETHKRLARTPVTTVDENPPLPTPEGVKICPGVAGGVEWNGPGFDPERHSLFVGALDYCSVYRSQPNTTPVVGGANMGGTWSGHGTASGWVTALEADTGKVRWQYHADSAVLGGVTPTAGGIVLTGDNAGNFRVFASDTGKVLKEVPTGGSLSGGIITYENHGRQYVAFTSGNVSRTLFGAVGRPTVVVMALPEAVVTKQEAARGPDVHNGRALFYGLCAVCHGADGKTWQGVDLTTVKQRLNQEQLEAFIRNPRAPMPRAFPEPLDAQNQRDIRDIAAFLMQWNGQ